MRTLLALCFILVVAVPCSAQTFTVNPVTHCPGYSQGYNISLFAGTYHIEYVSGAYSVFPDDSYQGGFVWQSQVQVYIFGNAQSATIGAAGLFTTAAAAEAAAQGIYTLVVPVNSVVDFYVSDLSFESAGCGNNRGSVTLKFVEPVKTEPTTWGKIKALYR